MWIGKIRAMTLVSSGPLARLAELLVQAPADVPASESLRVTVTVRIHSSGPRMITTSATSALLVLSGDRVVAKAEGVADAPAIPLNLVQGRVVRAQAVPDSVHLFATDTGEPLAPGHYALVAVLGYQNDPLNSAADVGRPRIPNQARPFVLVSAPVSIGVRAFGQEDQVH
jgi:hypothetical protein